MKTVKAHVKGKIPNKCACNGSTLTRFVQPVILIALSQGPDYGYSLLQKIAHTALWKGETPDPSGVYRALKDMEKRELISSSVVTGEESVMGTRMFSITDTGRECMLHWKDTLTAYRAGIDEIIGELDCCCGA